LLYCAAAHRRGTWRSRGLGASPPAVHVRAELRGGGAVPVCRFAGRDRFSPMLAAFALPAKRSTTAHAGDVARGRLRRGRDGRRAAALEPTDPGDVQPCDAVGPVICDPGGVALRAQQAPVLAEHA
jgi:hypothetical protein